MTFCRQKNIILLSVLFHDSLTTVGVMTVLLIGFQVFSRVRYCGRLGILGSWDLGILGFLIRIKIFVIVVACKPLTGKLLDLEA